MIGITLATLAGVATYLLGKKLYRDRRIRRRLKERFRHL